MITTPNDKPRCCHRVYYGDWGRSRQCARSGSVERDGKHYCKQHDPVAKDARREAVQAEWETARQTKKEQQDRIAVCLRACAGIHDPEKAVHAAREALEYALDPEYLQAISASHAADDADHSVVYSAHEMFRKALSLLKPKEETKP